MRRWSRDQDIHLTDHLLEVCKAIQLPPNIADDAVANVEHHDTKEELKKNTQEALDVHRVGCKLGTSKTYFPRHLARLGLSCIMRARRTRFSARIDFI
jgi:hypothetical protein